METSFNFSPSRTDCSNQKGALRSPYAPWVISLANPNIDISNVTEVRFEFALTYQTFAVQSTLAEADERESPHVNATAPQVVGMPSTVLLLGLLT